jgi:predicted ester cyclase
MNAETNKNIIKQCYFTFNKGGDVSFEKFFSSDFVDHNGYPDQIKGPDGVREGYKIWSKAFLDNHAELAEIVAENDKVVVRTIATGTHRGEFMGIAPTGKTVRVEGISIFRMNKGMDNP